MHLRPLISALSSHATPTGALLQGETGSGVEAEVQTSRGRRVLSLQRERLVVTPVQYQACGGERGVAYLRIAAFNQQTGKQVQGWRGRWWGSPSAV